jgi:glycosyltransferase involved in cell wall biosynthesis
MRILHLAYEDPRQPGSGGGSVRTVEINRRLAARHNITAIVAAYPGARARVEAGIEWVPIGTRTGAKLDRLSYFALVAREVLTRDADLIVEDFGAPFSVAFSPLVTRRPVVASVQWLFAREMRSRYQLPFDWVESAGIRCYRDFIAVSHWMAEVLRKRRPDASIEAIPNGVERAAFDTPMLSPKHLAFVGRLDVPSKGIDLLVDVVVHLVRRLGDATPRLLVLGDGPDRERLINLIRARRIEQHIDLLGRIDGAEKYALMASAHAVLMPSRFESFGIVAIEAQAVGVPLVAFDVGPLREITGGAGALLVRPFDVDAYAGQIATLVTRPELRAQLGESGRSWARRYDWDEIALQQEAHYERALAQSRVRQTADATR